MGVVYKVQDTKLDRTVALKFLAQHLLNDEEAKQRFLREAKAAAALSHPNICHVYEIDEADGKTFIAMEFLEGEPLEDRIAKGPLAIQDALEIARQAAEGLQAAHEKNVVHRDINPANILIDSKGRATIMDFGLARLTEASRLTRVDTAMGTVAYMSPEQAQGMDVDHRTDVWALGCVLYEMVAGQRPFLGQYDQALLYEIVHEEAPPLTSIRAGVPMELEFIVTECLAKDREDRTGTAQDVARKLRTLAEKLKSGRSTILRTANVTAAGPAVAGQSLTPAAAVAVIPPRSPQALRAIAAILALALLTVTLLHFREAPPATMPIVEFSADVPQGLLPGQLSLSPDARYLAMTVEPPGSLWVRSLDAVDWRELAGTLGARYPFWSANSKEIGFFADEKLKKIALGGAPPTTITEAPDGRGGSWGADGTILFSPAPGGLIQRVSESGGELSEVTQTVGPGDSHRFPQLLPDGRHFLFEISGAAPELVGGYLASLEDQTSRRLLPDASNAVFAPRGSQDSAEFLLFVRDGTLMAQPFDASSRQLAEGPVALPVTAAYAGNADFYGFSASGVGALVYSTAADEGPRRLVWADRTGTVTDRTDLVADGILSVSLSPEGDRVAYSAVAGGNRDIWTYDLIRQTRIRLSEQTGVDTTPVWSPDGKQMAFRATNPATFGDIYVTQTDGSKVPVALLSESVEELPTDWSQDGRFILYYTRGERTLYDLWYIERAASGEDWESRLFSSAPATERDFCLSPDGRYGAYVSDESGRFEVYVQPFPLGGLKTAVSTEGGVGPRWSWDGSELFYVTPDETLMAVPVSTRGDFSIGDAQRLFQRRGVGGDRRGTNYAVSLDGKRFLVTEPVSADGKPAAAANSSIRFVLNWQAKLLPPN